MLSRRAPRKADVASTRVDGRRAARACSTSRFRFLGSAPPAQWLNVVLAQPGKLFAELYVASVENDVRAPA